MYVLANLLKISILSFFVTISVKCKYEHTTVCVLAENVSQRAISDKFNV